MPISNQIPSSRLIQPGVVDSAATRPASPFEGQAIYQKDTDEVLYYNGTSWSRPWNMPWGLAGVATKTTSQSFSTLTDMDGLTTTFSAVAGRSYKATFSGNFFNSLSSAILTVYLTDSTGATSYMEISNSTTSAAYPYFSVSFATVITGLTAGTQTLKIRAVSSSTNTTLYGTATRAAYAAKLVIEDIGSA